MLSTQELTFNFIILWSAITDETKYEDTQDFTWWAEKIENYNLAGHPHALNFKNLRKYQMMSHKTQSSKHKTQILTHLKSFWKPSMMRLHLSLLLIEFWKYSNKSEISKGTKWESVQNIKGALPPGSEGWKGKLLVV